jgi:FkbM family methyltransferase
MIKIIIKILRKINWYKRILLTRLNLKRRYQINSIPIKIDHTHLLPDYERDFPHYDRFLSHLVKYLENNSVVVDIGANVGDTLIKMASSNDRLEYICIEPDNNFYEDLVHNSEILKIKKPGLKIKTIKKYIGLDNDNVSLIDGTHGSKRSAPTLGSIKSESLVNLFNELNISENKLSLIKSDVDGYDWDAIKSSYSLLINLPYIYFECFYQNMEQLDNFKIVISDLFNKGYTNFSFFDNYGQHICCINDLKNIHKLLDYIKRQNFSKSTRTIFYYDILAFTEERKKRAEQIIVDYNRY